MSEIPDNTQKLDYARKKMSRHLDYLKTQALDALIMAKRGLSDRQRLFLEEYITDLNTEAAAERAGVDRKIAEKWLSLTQFREVVDQRLDIIRKDNELLIKETLGQLRTIINADLTEFQHWNGETVTLFDSKDLKKSGAVKEVYNTEWGPRLVLYDRMDAIKLMSQIMNLVDKTKRVQKPSEELEAQESLVDALNKAWEKRNTEKAKSSAVDAKVEPVKPAGSLPAPETNG